MRIFIWLIFAALLTGCGNQGTEGNKQGAQAPDTVNVSNIPGNSHARGFMIDGFELTLLDPWSGGSVFERYTINTEGGKNDTSRNDSKDIEPPFNRWAVSSTTHIGFMKALGEAGKIVGCTSPDRIFDQEIYGRFRSGEIEKIGSDMEFNFESVLGIEPDIILQTAFEGQQQRDSRFLATGINFVYILEWLEPHPLGRAEWIKVFGLLTGKREMADSIFQSVADRYNNLKDEVTALDDFPLVMIGNNFNGTWYMPGGGNYMCRFLEDAGFKYPYIDFIQRGSLALNFENVLEEFRTADIWLGVSAKNLDELLKEDSRYNLFEPFSSGKVFSVNGRVNTELGNDYWESGVVYPDRILGDLVSIAHPELLPDHKLMYYKNLKRAN